MVHRPSPPPGTGRITGKAYQAYVAAADASSLRNCARILREHGHRHLARLVAAIAARIEPGQ